jgi:putative sigma-54 modulation protein
MIKRIEITGVHYEVTEKLKEYVTKKIGKLDRYLPKHARESAHTEVILKEQMIKTKKECICEVIMHVPGENIAVTESTINMFAAVDIVEAKLKNLLKKYKETHSSLRIHRRVLARLRRSV